MTPEEKEMIVQFAVEHLIPFNKSLEIKYDSYEPLTVSLEKKPDLVGNALQDMLHGGVIATLIDVAGGVSLLKNILESDPDITRQQLMERFSRTGTVDLRIDYIRPGKGIKFFASGEIIRHGKRITVTRMELKNEVGTLIACGTGTYVV